MSLRTRLVTIASRPHLARRSIRLRLSLLYGSLFLVSGAVLLGFTYLLVRGASNGTYFFTAKGGKQDGIVFSSSGTPDKGSQLQISVRTAGHPSGLPTIRGVSQGGGKGSGLSPKAIAGAPTPKQVAAQVNELQRLALAEHTSELHTLLRESAAALIIMALLSIALGWLVAGRVLRPLRTITATAQQISASNLHERLDMTGRDELKELGDTFDGLLGRLEASFQSQRQFVTNASHELRTPLARQQTLIQVALDDPHPTVASLRAAHERVLTSGRQQEELIDALLTLSRVQAGAERLEPVDLAPIVRDVLASRTAEVKERGLTLSSTLASAPTIGDPRLIERLVVNLIDNALRHNVPSGHIELATGQFDSQAYFTVSNDGALIQQAGVDRLYEPFQRHGTERTASSEGLGLGLCIVQAVAVAHGATLSTRARPEGGLETDVRFTGLNEAPE